VKNQRNDSLGKMGNQQGVEKRCRHVLHEAPDHVPVAVIDGKIVVFAL
jgi:hypothetical protein